MNIRKELETTVYCYIATESGPILDEDGLLKTFEKKEKAEIFMFLERVKGEVRPV